MTSCRMGRNAHTNTRNKNCTFPRGRPCTCIHTRSTRTRASHSTCSRTIAACGGDCCCVCALAVPPRHLLLIQHTAQQMVQAGSSSARAAFLQCCTLAPAQLVLNELLPPLCKKPRDVCHTHAYAEASATLIIEACRKQANSMFQ